MPSRLSILTVLVALSTVFPVYAEAEETPRIGRCVQMRLDNAVAPRFGQSLKRMKLREEQIGDGPVILQPQMAGLIGPTIKMLGRDVRLAVTTQQTSPQELWQKSVWNTDRLEDCIAKKQSWTKSIGRNFYWKGIIDNQIGVTTYQPKIMYRSRAIGEAILVRPYGFTFGAGLSVPLSTNTQSLLMLPDTRVPVRRDMAHYANSMAIERLYASWRTTPITDLHLAVSAGQLEEMYGGVGAEILYRPFGTPFWAGVDAWELRRRDNTKAFNFAWTNEAVFTGHARIGYDIPDTRATIALAVGRYLAGDTGATFSYLQRFENGARIEGALTWTNRREDEGFFRDAHFDPTIRVVWPLGKTGHREARLKMHQVGRDGGQMLDRPLPLEQMTEAFSTREITRQWPQMLEARK